MLSVLRVGFDQGVNFFGGGLVRDVVRKQFDLNMPRFDFCALFESQYLTILFSVLANLDLVVLLLSLFT